MFRSNFCMSESALGYVIRCHSILAKMYLMPVCPIFWGAEKIKTGSQPVTVQTEIPDMEVVSFDPETDTLLEFPLSFSTWNLGNQSDSILQGSGLLKVWFIMLDGLVSAVSSCPVASEVETINTLFTILQSMKGPEYRSFGLFCLNHLLLPSIQNWVRNCQANFLGWQKSCVGVKQTLGLTTDVVIEWIQIARSETRSSVKAGVKLLLSQLIIVLTECTLVSSETVATFSSACFTHLIESQGKDLSKEEWDMIILGLARSSQMTLFPLHQLMTCFQRGSHRFYGDMGSVKIAARRDSTIREFNRNNQLCQQIFLVEEQRLEPERKPGNPEEEDRSYLFILNQSEETSKDESKIVRVSVRNLITGLTAHGCIARLFHKITEEYLDFISSNGVRTLLHVMKQSSDAAHEFDSRPGLKYLMSKVAQLPCAANLYTQLVTLISSRLYLVLLFKKEIKSQDKTKAKESIEKVEIMKSHLKDLVLELVSRWSQFSTISSFVADDSMIGVYNQDLVTQIKEKKLRRLSVTSNDVIDTIEKVIESKEKEEYKSAPERGVSKISSLNKVEKDLKKGSNNDNEGNDNEAYDNEANGNKDKDNEDKDNEEIDNEDSGKEDNDNEDNDNEDKDNEDIDNEDIDNEDNDNVDKDKEDKDKEDKDKEDNVKEDLEKDNVEKVVNMEKGDLSIAKEVVTNDVEEMASQPFQFSDFAEQPNRPDSPNLSIGSSPDDQNTGKEVSNQTTPKKPSPKTTTDIETCTGKDYDPSVPSNDKSKDENCLDLVSSALSVYKKQKTNLISAKRKNPFDASSNSETTKSCENLDPDLETEKSDLLKQDEDYRDNCLNYLLLSLLNELNELEDEELKVVSDLVYRGLSPLQGILTHETLAAVQAVQSSASVNQLLEITMQYNILKQKLF